MTLYDNKYTFIKDLGSGSFGKVFLAKEKVSNRYVAIKQLINTNRSEQMAIPGKYKIIKEIVAEAIVNAITHRDYLSNGSLQVVLFSNRIFQQHKKNEKS